ncbi:MAG: alanine--tRNA ligase [Oscillospiraceae bacterium]|jgi:alanyl-tRNA synthetase|nr:alanine--tRNA ligase [Oscillospiraceae bacterium]
MEKFGLNDLREKFLSFFESKGHLRLPSFSLIPQNDASLLLINSGMAPMKPWFTGEQAPPSRRVCTCQKCIRTGDIDNIGHTSRHGTYFEMLGNFSFGDYFKREAISWSWEFLTSPDWLGMDPDRLYPSVYLEDDEAFAIWRELIGIPEARIAKLGKADNFWEHGSGPCGPCSEIYFDRGEKYGCGRSDCRVGCDCDRFIEIWNNVFTQFNNDGAGHYTDLAQKNIDTGMGLERLAVVCQGVDSLFDVDAVMRITNKVGEMTGARYGRSESVDVSLRVITDHIRSATMMICDGVLPSNEGRGYVLRRLLRRAARHGKLLGVNDPFLFAVCATVIAESRAAYPELVQKQAYITRIIRIEEESFARTIDAGMKLACDMLEAQKRRGETLFDGASAFKLYDTYGFPVDLTAEIAGEQGLLVDRAVFDACMQAQRVRAREARAAMGDLAWAGVDLGLDSTPTKFIGYDCGAQAGRVLAIVVGEELSSKAVGGDEAIFVLDRTPFYAEMGGQTADRGTITAAGGEFTVTDVQKNKSGKYMHHGVMKAGFISVEDTVTAAIDPDRRQAVMRAHSATHLLHKALRTVLGEHVEQAGSLVEPDRLRFDFTHFSAVTPEELTEIERRVNRAILAGYPVDIREMPMNEARALGAMALFSEKYGDLVRVVNMGGYSVELCGGTHLDNTAKIGPFRIESEFSVAAGVRRITAIAGELVMEEMRRGSELLRRLSAALKTNTGDVEEKFLQLVQDFKNARKLIERLQAQQLRSEADRVMFGAKTIKGLKIITGVIPGVSPDALRQMGDMLRDRDESLVAVLASAGGEKISLVSVCGDGAIARGIRAGDLIRHVTAITGGSGGGKPQRAMGGAKDELLLDDALAAVDNYVDEKAQS